MRIDVGTIHSEHATEAQRMPTVRVSAQLELQRQLVGIPVGAHGVGTARRSLDLFWSAAVHLIEHIEWWLRRTCGPSTSRCGLAHHFPSAFSPREARLTAAALILGPDARAALVLDVAVQIMARVGVH